MEKTYIEILVLAQIIDKPRHAYEIRKNINDIFFFTKTINNNVLYPLMKKLIQEGNAVQEVIVQDDKPNRKVYSITEKGMKEFKKLLAEFSEMQANDEMEFYTRVLLLDYLEKEQIRFILDQREKVLVKLGEFYDSYNKRDKEVYIFNNESEMICHLRSLLKEEMCFLEELRNKYLGQAVSTDSQK